MRSYETPRILQADAYTIGSSNRFESNAAQERSSYYLTFRKGPGHQYYYDNTPYQNPNDNRIVFCGLQRIIDRLLRKPITHDEIDETCEFLKSRKASMTDLVNFDFDEYMWRIIVDEFGGIIPIQITGMPEGSVVYPHEPVIRVHSIVDDMGPLAAWFESKIVQVWATTERATQARHWLKYNFDMIREIESPNTSNDSIMMMASMMMHDFGDRAGMCAQESEDLGLTHLYCFPGTDTFAGSYQAYKNGSGPGVGVSVDALAHRIVQGFVDEGDSYETIYDLAKQNSIISMVADCYDYYNAVNKYLIPLAKRSVEQDNGKIVVARPDSGDAKKQILWTLDRAVEMGLYEERNGFKYMTALRVIEGDGMTFKSMKEINNVLISKGYAPHGCLTYGVGGSLRNSLKRDNFSTKYALYSVGKDKRPVIKKSHTPGKATLPDVIVTRDPNCLNKTGCTIQSTTESYIDEHVVYYDGSLGFILDESFDTIQNRVLHDFENMPECAGIISYKVLEETKAILKRYESDVR